MNRLRVIFAGSGEFGLPTLLRLIESPRHEIVQVVTQPDRPAGRGLKLTPTPVAELAAERGLPLIRTGNINLETLAAADVMVVIAFGQKIAPRVVDHPRLGSINLHGSLLPKYRGAAPVNWAIIAGETVTGNSVIRLAQRMDAGAILGQSERDVDELTAGELHDLLAADGAPLILRVLDELASGTATERAQDDAQATLAPKLTRQHAVIDWSAAAVRIARQVRGMSPWPGCRVRLLRSDGSEAGRATLVRARAVEAASGAALPGQIASDGAVACGEGAVLISELQPEGKRTMTLDAYRNGHPWEAGMRLESIT